jgi:signal transduction histidine kinase
VPELAEILRAAGRGPEMWADTPQAEIEREGEPREIEVWPVEGGRLGLIRDLSARRELERRRRETQRLVSHELKTPLASIAGFGSMLERYPMSEEELKRVAGLIRGEAERLGEMVRVFLDLERLGAGQLEAERQKLDLSELVRRRCEFLAPPAVGRGQEIVLEAPEPVEVHGAPELLERVVDNLVGNALKYAPEGSVVEVTVAENGSAAIFAVRDHGPGIPAEALPRLFERFYRVPGSPAGGSGLGLALVREVAQWHGGSVEVSSAPGEGARFTVRLPFEIQPEDRHGAASAGS